MNRSNEGRGSIVLFGATTWALHDFTTLGAYAWIGALVLMALGWLLVRVMGRAVSRHGWRGWAHIGALAALAAAYVYLAPNPLIVKLLTLWVVGVPLVLLGAGVQWICDRFPWTVPWFDRGAVAMVILLPAAFAIAGLWEGDGFWPGLSAGLAFTSAIAVLMLLGAWLAATESRELHEARFGSAERFTDAGVSDER